ncbi:hypothetical protein AAV35_014080 (plasmid) [Salimicrobium jeotgali]|nr:hypothetical protein AAV35_014080 [Salimicrobium jeotgali]
MLSANSEKESLVVGLYGKWGSGKTSVFNLIKSKINSKKNNDLISISFNPWYFKDGEQLISQFFNSFINELNKSSEGNNKELIKNLKRYSEKLTPITIKTGLINFSFKDFKTRMEHENIFILREKIEKNLVEEDKRVVVFIDDLDRLDNEEIAQVLKLVKLIADFKFTTYILAFDEEVVSTAIADKYDQQSELGTSFLEKIIQVPINLPQPGYEDIRLVLLEGIEEILNNNKISLTHSETIRLKGNMDGSFGYFNFNLRTVKRYLNSISFAIPTIKGEINVVDLLCIEGVRIFFPQIHKFIFNHSKAFLNAGRSTFRKNTIHEEYKELLNELFSNYSDEEKKKIKAIIEDLFPRSKFLFTGNNKYGDDWEKKWFSEQRICSEDYFHKYFIYDVKHGVISDHEYHWLLEELQEKDTKKVCGAISNLVEKHGFSNLLKKLRYVDNELQSNSGEKLSLSLARLGEKVPEEPGVMQFFTSIAEAAKLICKLILLQSKDYRMCVTINIIKNSSSLKLSSEIFFRLVPNEEREQETLSEEEIEKVAQTLIPKIKDEMYKGNFFDEHPTSSSQLLLIWSKWGDESVFKVAIEKYFAQDRGIEEFLEAFSNRRVNLSTGAPSTKKFDDSSYADLRKIYPPEKIVNRLIGSYPTDLEKINETIVKKEFEENSVVESFLLFYLRDNE